MKCTAAVALLLLTSAVARAQLVDLNGLGGSKQPQELVTIELAADTTAIAPGKPFLLAATLTPVKGFHIYWSNPGESGVTTSFTPQLPAGFSAEMLPMPLPKAFVQPGDITGYGYSGATTFLFKITPPAALPADAPTIKMAARWLCCDEQKCVPGKGEAALKSIRHGADGKPANEAFFAAAQELLPAASAPSTIVKKEVKAESSRADKRLSFTIPVEWNAAPAKVEAFPDAPEQVDVTIPKIETTEGTTRITLTARILAGQTPKSNKVPLLIVYTSGDGKRRGFFTPLDLSPLLQP